MAGSSTSQDDALHPNRTGYAWANAVLGQVRSYQESMGRVPDDRRQKTWAWYVQDTWKPTPKITLDLGLRMYKWGQALAQGGESVGLQPTSVSIRAWGGNPPVFYQPVLVGTTRSARNPVTGQVLPATFIGLIVPGTGYNCTQVITAQNPCAINGIVTQRDGNYLESGDEGFIEPLPIQFDPRFGMAWAVNPRTVIRVAGGSFHDGTGGTFGQQGDGERGVSSEQDDLLHRFRLVPDAGAAPSPVPNTGGPIRTDNERPNNIRFTSAIQREIGKNVVVDAAYVGNRTSTCSATTTSTRSRMAPVRSGVPGPDLCRRRLEPGRAPGSLSCGRFWVQRHQHLSTRSDGRITTRSRCR